jgi:Conserved hypothetical protein 95
MTGCDKPHGTKCVAGECPQRIRHAQERERCAGAGKRLWSPQDCRTRPMMEKVRAAVFSMLLAQSAGTNRFGEGMRWLDLFAGTVRRRPLRATASYARALCAHTEALHLHVSCS